MVALGRKSEASAKGLIELDSLDTVSSLCSSVGSLPTDSKGFVLLRTPQRGKSFRVFRPPLIDEVERQWTERGGAIGRWRVKSPIFGGARRTDQSSYLLRREPVSPNRSGIV